VGPDGAALPTAVAGHLLHYYCPDFESFVAKYRRFSDHPDVHLWNNPVDPLKRLWRDVVNAPGATEAGLRAYFARWVAFDDRAVRRLARTRWLGVWPRRAAVVEVTGPRRALAATAAAETAGVTPGGPA
jgi:hypothetical protein